MLAVISPSHASGFRSGTSALASGGGQLIVVLGRLSTEDAAQLAAARRGNAPAMALLLAVSRWAADAVGEDTERAAETLTAAGWRVAVATASTPLPAAWQQLHRPADRPLAVGGLSDFGGEQR
jgi:ribosomal protein S11